MTQISFLEGNLGRDPEIRFTQKNNAKVATFSIATYRKNPNDKDKPFTDWFNVVACGDQADIAEQHLKKGSYVILVGKFRTRDYEKDGKKVYVTEFWVDETAMVLKKDVAKATANEFDQTTLDNDDDLPF